MKVPWRCFAAVCGCGWLLAFEAAAQALCDEPPPGLRQALLQQAQAIFAGRLAQDGDEKPLDPLQELAAKEPARRRAAAKALGLRGKADAVPALAAALKDADDEVRINAALALAKLGPAARLALAPLAEALRDPDGNVRAAALAALGCLNLSAAQALPHYQVGLQDAAAIARQAASVAVAGLGAEAKPLVPRLLALCKDEHAEVRLAATFAVGRCAKEDKAALVRLRELKEDKDPAMRLEASWALWMLTKAPEHLKELENAARRGDPRLRDLAADRLAAAVREMVRDDAAKALAYLKQSSSPALRAAMGEALAELEPAQLEGVLPQLLEMLNDGMQRDAAYKALTKLGAKALPGLRQKLKAESDSERREAAKTLGLLGAAASPAVDDLIAALKDKDYSVRFSAAEALGLLGKDAKQALPALKEAAKDAHQLVRHKASVAIAQIEGTPVPTMSAPVRGR